MMLDLENLIDALRQGSPVHTLNNGREVMLVPNEFSVKTVSEFDSTPPRIIAGRPLHDGESLARYAQRYKSANSLMLADINASTIVVALDYHGPNEPSNVDHVAFWQVQHSEEFRTWKNFCGKLHGQGDFVAFLEENVIDIIEPEPASMLELAKDFSANKTISFKSARRLDNGDRKLTYVEETGTSGGIEIPQKIKLSMPIFFREEPVEFSAWFRYRINDGELKLGFDMLRMEPVLQAAFNSAVYRVSEEADLEPYFGAKL